MHEQTRKYWQYEYDVAAKYMIPLLEHWGSPVKGASVIDVGCGEGGGLCAMYDAGAVPCCGFDVEVGRIDAANELKEHRNIPLAIGNLYEDELPFSTFQYDLVILHDVFEHLDNKDQVMKKLAAYSKPTGNIMITFPPYYSAYGAHQQLLNTSWAKLPFFHLLPFAMTQVIPRLKGEEQYFLDEVRKLGRLKMGMKKFEAIVERNGLTVSGKQAYLISPNHIRFGLKPIPAGQVAEIPVIGEVVCTGVVYLLSKTQE
ncbi:MAG: class I SAM-dependent methyltransferase [Bacteroidetes bacterium]|nr:class I SAM-dependent methyltransferase [Bacteroidota bacterium]MCW5895859.1 class I SAM-dependent methyltransferase [Bacteroidota bacterium]